MKILMLYPEYPDTFWSFTHALKFVSKKAAFPPLGLLTVAAMLPADWQIKLVDLNVSRLADRDIKWADMVFISAMVVQKDSAKSLIKRCKKLDATVVAGGPLFTTQYQEFSCVDHLVLGEAESNLKEFLDDLQHGCARRVYMPGEWKGLQDTPAPMWKLIDQGKYSSLSLQYSRGCPFDCEFCDIVVLNGHLPRTKSSEQVIRELDIIYGHGWNNSVFIVDDNFIGNKKKLKTVILPAIINWMEAHSYPFTLFTQASINLADDDQLIRMMGKANFTQVFIGIESPNAESLAECGKSQNKSGEMISAIKKLQQHGLEVQGGFIIGFDSDPKTIFQDMINFVQGSGIVTAMVGLLTAPKGTKLYQRLSRENRLLGNSSGNNTDFSLNFIPKMNKADLLEGYRKVINTIYGPKQYYERVKAFLNEYHPQPRKTFSLKWEQIKAFAQSIWVLGICEKGRMYYWKLLGWTMIRRPSLFVMAVTLSIYGFHFRKIAESCLPATLTESHASI